MATKLSLYQGACAAIGTRRLVSLTENQLSRRELDGVFDRGAVRQCLSMAQWKFSIRAQKMEYEPEIEPDFGLRRAFQKPADWVRTAAVCSDEYYSEPMIHTNIADEAGFLFADLDTLYVKFVSDDSEFGGDYTLWPENFTAMVEGFFAKEVCLRLTNDKELKAILDKDFDALLMKAKNTDAMDDGTKFPPLGSWSRARLSRTSRRDRGSRGSLIG
jgi:hypothetical protein